MDVDITKRLKMCSRFSSVLPSQNRKNRTSMFAADIFPSWLASCVASFSILSLGLSGKATSNISMKSSVSIFPSSDFSSTLLKYPSTRSNVTKAVFL